MTSPTSVLEKDDAQEEAVSLCASHERVVCVTGAAGTGKTTVMQRAAEAVLATNVTRDKVVFCAPTGRAAKRITEVTGQPAVTIHRMMGYTKPDADDVQAPPRYGPNKKLPYSVIFMDETSMVDTELFNAVTAAMSATARIRLFGDANQLPPVQGKSPFLRMIAKFPTVVLEHNYRSDSGIIQAASSILQGKFPQYNDQFKMLRMKDANAIINVLAEICQDNAYGSDTAQIVTPINRGRVGTKALNQFLQSMFNKRTRNIEIEGYSYYNKEATKVVLRPGDKIVWTKNDYNLKLYNGEMGRLLDFDEHTGNLECKFNDRVIEIPQTLENYDPTRRSTVLYDPRTQIELGYAVTTHKSQGSEFDKIIYILPRGAYKLLSRNNFYTAVTRAKDHCTVLYQSGVIDITLKTKAS